MKLKNSYFGIVFITVIVFLWLIFNNSSAFINSYDHEKWSYVYSESPYIRGSGAKLSIGDDKLFAVAGYYLVMQGGDPSKIHFESPPLGEYIIGLSLFLFKNELVVNIVYASLFLLGTFLLGNTFFNNKVVSSLATLFIVLDPLFHQHVTRSLLDLPQAVFILLSIFFFQKSENKKIKFYLISSFFLGCATATKFFPGVVFFVCIYSFIIYKKNKKNFFAFLYSLTLVPIVFITSYAVYFNNHTVLEFFKFQWWVMKWRMGNPQVFGNILFGWVVGWYRSWWWKTNGWIRNEEWSVLSPIVMVFGLGGPVFLKKIRANNWLYFYGLVLIFISYLSVLTTGVAKYIFPIYPLLALFAAFSLYQTVLLLWKNHLFVILSKWWKK